MVNLMGAAQAYQLNVSAVQATMRSIVDEPHRAVGAAAVIRELRAGIAAIGVLAQRPVGAIEACLSRLMRESESGSTTKPSKSNLPFSHPDTSVIPENWMLSEFRWSATSSAVAVHSAMKAIVRKLTRR